VFYSEQGSSSGDVSPGLIRDLQRAIYHGLHLVTVPPEVTELDPGSVEEWKYYLRNNPLRGKTVKVYQFTDTTEFQGKRVLQITFKIREFWWIARVSILVHLDTDHVVSLAVIADNHPKLDKAFRKWLVRSLCFAIIDALENTT
jgi:hypothetical protein